MPKSKIINFALLGLGKLGSGFYKIYTQKKDQIQKQTGYQLKLQKILVKNPQFKRPSFVDRSLITTNIDDILNNQSIKMAVDAIGGIEPTFSIIRKLIEHKIHIVSANRVMLASKMYELTDLANEHKIYIQPEPSLGGGIPILNALQRDLLANKITSLVGVISGTSNFILSEMTRRGVSMREVLKSPQLLKMGESLSIIDYEGSDAAQKVSILAASAFGVYVNFLRIHAEGISDITTLDIQSASEFGYEFKLLAILKDHEEALEVRVHPTLVPKDHPITLVRDMYNAFFIQTDLLGNYMVYGRGVGIEATSSLILRDIVAIGNYIRTTGMRSDAYRLDWNDKPIMDMNDIQSAYYIRIPCTDKPGVIGEITSVLGRHGINIGSAHAEVDKAGSSDLGYVHILIDMAKEGDIKKALSVIKDLEIIRDKIKLFRIL